MREKVGIFLRNTAPTSYHLIPHVSKFWMSKRAIEFSVAELPFRRWLAVLSKEASWPSRPQPLRTGCDNKFLSNKDQSPDSLRVNEVFWGRETRLQYLIMSKSKKRNTFRTQETFIYKTCFFGILPADSLAGRLATPTICQTCIFFLAASRRITNDNVLVSACRRPMSSNNIASKIFKTHIEQTQTQFF